MSERRWQSKTSMPQTATNASSKHKETVGSKTCHQLCSVQANRSPFRDPSNCPARHAVPATGNLPDVLNTKEMREREKEIIIYTYTYINMSKYERYVFIYLSIHPCDIFIYAFIHRFPELQHDPFSPLLAEAMPRLARRRGLQKARAKGPWRF